MRIAPQMLMSLMSVVGCKTSTASSVKATAVLASSDKNIECEFYHRASTSVPPSDPQKKSCTLESSEGGSPAPFPESFKIGGFSLSVSCDQSLSIAADFGSQQLHRVVHQQIPPRISDDSGSSHGFTGLNYITGEKSEVQYWCKKSGARIECTFANRQSDGRMKTC